MKNNLKKTGVGLGGTFLELSIDDGVQVQLSEHVYAHLS